MRICPNADWIGDRTRKGPRDSLELEVVLQRGGVKNRFAVNQSVCAVVESMMLCVSSAS